ncbi:low molecular weight phosphotyrosine protein phosphatase [Jeotgalibacillus proteolyticus]|nr:low molecular weight phosphotyrosine protein phosphatase [Jeotgalibacillus proteolyticus]
MKRVLFAGMENTSCSLMAEAVFNDLIRQQELGEKISSESAGINQWMQGKEPDPLVLELLRENGVSAEGLNPKQLVREDLETFDYILCMDQQTGQEVQKLLRASAGKPFVFLFLEFINSHTISNSDPYYTDDSRKGYNLIVEGSKELIKKLKNE